MKRVVKAESQDCKSMVVYTGVGLLSIVVPMRIPMFPGNGNVKNYVVVCTYVVVLGSLFSL